MIQCPFVNPTEPLVRAADSPFSNAKKPEPRSTTNLVACVASCRAKMDGWTLDGSVENSLHEELCWTPNPVLQWTIVYDPFRTASSTARSLAMICLNSKMFYMFSPGWHKEPCNHKNTAVFWGHSWFCVHPSHSLRMMNHHHLRSHALTGWYWAVGQPLKFWIAQSSHQMT